MKKEKIIKFCNKFTKKCIYWKYLKDGWNKCNSDGSFEVVNSKQALVLDYYWNLFGDDIVIDLCRDDEDVEIHTLNIPKYFIMA